MLKPYPTKIEILLKYSYKMEGFVERNKKITHKTKQF